MVAADVRVGKPGSLDERSGGDAGAALLLGEGPAIADVLGLASETLEVLDRWRDPRRLTGEVWEERFGFEQYSEPLRRVADELLAMAGLTEADHVVITSSNPAVTKRAGSLVKGTLSTTGSPVGFSGAADPILALAAVLDTAGAGETVLVLSAVDGCDGVLLQTTDLLPERRARRPVGAQLESGREVDYPTYLSWRGLLERELPRRPEPDRPAGPPSARAEGWKFGFTGSRCTECGFLHLPPLRVCRACSAADAMETVSGADLTGSVATFTVDRLAYSPSPPVVDVVVDFDGRRPHHARGRRRRSRRGGRGRRGRPGLPSPLHRRRRAQLLLEGTGALMGSNGIKDAVAIVGMGCTRFGERWESSTDDLLLEAVEECLGQCRHRT